MNENHFTDQIDHSEMKADQPNFRDEINDFIKHIEAQADIVPLVMGLLRMKILQESKLTDKFIKENKLIEKEEKNTNKRNILIPSDKFKEFNKLYEKVEKTELAFSLLPKNFIVSFVSQYDAYLGRLIRLIFISKPELLNSSEKNIMFSELIKFKSIEEAKEFIIEKEVETVLRESHLKQFKWLENKLGIPLSKDLPSFNDFIEITERRNLFVHCNGIVSRQYIEVCKYNHVKDIDKVKIGDKLEADTAYFNKCYFVLFEIGVKIGHVIWRKLDPKDLETADTHLNNVSYQLLFKGHNRLALNLLTFATDTLKKHYDQEIKCIFTINKALAHYLSGNKEDCNKVLAEHDWSATSDIFKLAISVLKEEYENAIKTMRLIGKNNTHINQDAYREWPLFKEFRKDSNFKIVYLEIFNEDFVYVEKKPKNIEDIVTEMKQLRKEAEMEEKASNSTISES